LYRNPSPPLLALCFQVPKNRRLAQALYQGNLSVLFRMALAMPNNRLAPALYQGMALAMPKNAAKPGL
jgi:hypothetical protein